MTMLLAEDTAPILTITVTVQHSNQQCSNILTVERLTNHQLPIAAAIGLLLLSSTRGPMQLTDQFRRA